MAVLLSIFDRKRVVLLDVLVERDGKPVHVKCGCLLSVQQME